MTDTVLPAVRTRTRVLPHFTERPLFSPRGASIDKLTVKLDHTRLSLVDERFIEELAYHLGRGELFHLPRRSGSHIIVSSNKRDFIFAADITFKPAGLGEYVLSASISLSLVRFVARNFAQLHDLAQTSAEALLRDMSPGTRSNDNFIPELHLHRLNGLDWPSMAVGAVTKAFELVRMEVDRTFDGLLENESRRQSSPRIDWSERLVCREHEVFWEFRCTQPAAAIDALKLDFDRTFSDMEVSDWRSIRLQRKGVGKTLKASFRNRDELVCYSKRQDRLRVEFRFKANVRRTLGRMATHALIPSTKLTDLESWSRRLIDVAADKVRNAFERLPQPRAGQADDPTVADLLRLIRLISAEAPDEALAAWVLNELVFEGRLVPNESPGQSAIVDRLRAIGFLQAGRIGPRARQRVWRIRDIATAKIMAALNGVLSR